MASAAVADAIIEHLSKGAFRPAWAALDTAYAYAEVFAPVDLRRCIEATLTLLQTIDPSGRSLACHPTSAQPTLGRRRAIALARGPYARSTLCSHNRALWPCIAKRKCPANVLLKEVAPYLTLSKDQEKALADMVRDLRRRVLEKNSSAVSGCIAGLLEAPGVSGKSGVDDALAALRAVMGSAEEAHRSIGLRWHTNLCCNWCKGKPGCVVT